MLNKSKSNYHAGCLLLWKTEAPSEQETGSREGGSGHRGHRGAGLLLRHPSRGLLTSIDELLSAPQATPFTIESLHIQFFISFSYAQLLETPSPPHSAA
jgi:hypothetical protein